MAADRRRHRAVAVAAIVAVAALLAGCSGADSPEVPGEESGTADPVLVTGRDVYQSACASCHGASGGGGAGPALDDGRMVAAYPELADQIDVIANGQGAMPAFGDRLSDEEVEAVTRYTREVL